MSFISLEEFKVKLATFTYTAKNDKNYVFRQYSGKEYLKIEKSRKLKVDK